MKLIYELRIAYKFPEIRAIVLKGISCWFLFWGLMPFTVAMRILPYAIGQVAQFTFKSCEWLLDYIPSPSGYFFEKRQEYIDAAHHIVKPDIIKNKMNE